jgi:acylglycerol lipase
VFAIHGYADHSDYRIHEFAHDLSTNSGFMTIAIDQPGFGRSDGLYGFIPDWLQHVHACAGAMIEILDEVRVGSLRELPVLAYGQSMGGGLIICMSILYPALFKGIVMTGPMCGINPNLKHHPIIENFFTDVARWFPTLPITPVPDLSMLCFKDFKLWERDWRRNKLAFKLKPRLGTAKAMLEAQVWITKNAHKLKSPILILHGDCDRVTSLSGSCRFLEAAGSSDKRMETIEGGYHIMLGYGIDKSVSVTVFNKIRDWLTNHT